MVVSAQRGVVDPYAGDGVDRNVTMTVQSGPHPFAMPVLFPPRFVWGAATSAYQVEGSPLADDAGPSIWHRFTHTPGHIADGATGDVACDQYRRYADDVALMQALGLGAYRFSVAWARVMPEGTGRVNEAGLAYYDRLVDALLEHGVTPFPTLYHWDLPAALDDRGGWLSPDVAGWFADYADTVVRRLGDRIPTWTTLNEPWVSVHAGYVAGTHAPGHRNAYEAPRAAHHLLLAHAAGTDAARAAGAREVGIAVNLVPRVPASDAPADRDAARRADAYLNRFFLDPLFLGRYPDEMADLFGEAWPAWPAADLARIAAARPDFVGINYYLRETLRDAPHAWPTRAETVRQPGSTYTEMGWEVHPPGVTDTLAWVADRYGRPPTYITENGAAFYDPPRARDGRVADPLRVQYLRDHLLAVHDAIAGGADVRGYFAWTLLDNFEWEHGYRKRFGLVHVDDGARRGAQQGVRLAAPHHGRRLGRPPARPAARRRSRAGPAAGPYGLDPALPHGLRSLRLARATDAPDRERRCF